MKKYDVVIVDSGPAGGECARLLALSSCKVYLADRMRKVMDVLSHLVQFIAATHIKNKLKNPNHSFDRYQKKLQTYYGFKLLLRR